MFYPMIKTLIFFTEKVFVESEATGIVAYTINHMTILTNLDSKTFPVSDFSQRAKENGWISNESVFITQIMTLFLLIFH